jgi:predicted unusual protein kinase regulating ubiquinone biosynthesis (AarF/ABC1/UbiB family)
MSIYRLMFLWKLVLPKKLHYTDFHDSRILYEEIDYINEGKNADRFRRDFRNVKWVRVPVSFLDLTMPF